jgi:RNA ligase
MVHVDIGKLQRLVEDGYLTARPHPTADLLIWNYTPRCQYERYWTPETMMCRGLITKLDGTVHARGFVKFFNYGEMPEQEIPLEPFKVIRKADGSLGILYQVDGKPSIATRGSFTSKQAIHATKLLHEKYTDFVFDPRLTYLFEIVYPANKYVVDYRGMDDIILLAIIDTEMGHEYDIHQDHFPFPVIETFDGLTDLESIQQMEEENEEGFVIRFESGLRLKIKFAEYKRLFKIMTSTSNRTIWEYLKENKPLAEILDRVPPEFEAWVKKTSKELGKQYLDIHNEVETVYKDILATTTIDLPFTIERTLSAPQFKSLDTLMKKRIKERFAEHAEIEQFLLMKWDGCKYYYPDGRRVTDKKAALRLHIWDSFYPEYARPFIVDGEEDEAV